MILPDGINPPPSSQQQPARIFLTLIRPAIQNKFDITALATETKREETKKGNCIPRKNGGMSWEGRQCLYAILVHDSVRVDLAVGKGS